MSDAGPAFWHYADDAAREALSDAPLELLNCAVTVKSNAVRKVFRSGDYFIKFDRRSARSFRNEFRAAQLCEKYAIPAVKHLAWGGTREGSYLITRAAEGFIEGARVFRTRRDWALYTALADFLKTLLQAPVWHPDLHPGNILLDPESGACLLVDLHGIRRRGFWDFFRRYLMERCIVEVRDYLADEEMHTLIARCGIGDPERFLNRALVREAAYLRENFPRRRRQILNGYFKYTAFDASGQLVRADLPENALEGAEEMETPDARELFLFSFFLEQSNLPCRRVLAFDEKHSLLRLEKEVPPERRSAASAEQLQNRLRINGIESSPADFGPGFLDDVVGVFQRNR